MTQADYDSIKEYETYRANQMAIRVERHLSELRKFTYLVEKQYETKSRAA